MSTGTANSQNIVSAFEVISNNVSLIKVIMTELNNSTQEQSKGIERVNVSMQNINSSSDQSAQSISATNSEGLRLKEQADKLFDSMTELEVILNGRSDHTMY